MDHGLLLWADLFRLLILVIATRGAFSVLGELALGIRQRRRAAIGRNRSRQLWRYAALGGFLVTVVITELLRIHHYATWHTWTDFAWSLMSWVGVHVNRRRSGSEQ